MEPEYLASQLRCPSGEKAREVGISMNTANYNLNRECIKLLELNDDNRVLEIGPGNGAFVQEILQEAKGINYEGIDISTALVAEATRLNDYQFRKVIAKF